MRTSTAVVDLEISGRFTELNVPDEFAGALVLFRLHGRPLGWGAAPVTGGRLDRGSLVRQLLEQHAWSCALPIAEKAVLNGVPPRAVDVGSLLLSPPQMASTGPLVTVAVCNRTPAAQLRPSLEALVALDYSPLDLVLIDASDDRNRIEALIRNQFPSIRYCSAPGSGAAPRKAVSECRGDILALTHGDAVVDSRWISRLATVFLADPDVMTVTGLTLPSSFQLPMRGVLPAGTPFCRQWSRVGVDWSHSDSSMQKVFELAAANIAFWQPGSAYVGPYTHVFEPSAIVRASTATTTMPGGIRRVPVTHAQRSVDLATGLSPIVDATKADTIELDVTWAGMPLGTAHIEHHGAVVSPLWIADAVAQQLTAEVLDARLGVGEHVCRALLTADLARHIVGRLGIDCRSVVSAPKRPAAAA